MHAVTVNGEARTLAPGTTVTVRGTVTVPTGAFDGGFAIQDGDAGLYILDSGAAPRALGDRVELTGTIADSFGLLAIQPTAIATRGDGPRIPARPTRTGAVGEATEGRLLHLAGRLTGEPVDDGPFGTKLEIDDGSGPVQVFLYPGAGVSLAGLHAGVAIETTCFSNQFDVFYECDPASAAGLTIR